MGGPVLGVDIVPWGEMTNADKDDPHLSQADWCLDSRELPIKDNSMDFVFSHHSLEHIGEQNIVNGDTFKALEEWARVLKPGGYLVVVLPDINTCIPPIARKRGLHTHHGLEPDEVRALLGKLPLEVIRFNEFSEHDIFEFVAVKCSQ